MQQFYTEPARELPVYGNFDVIVIGGGVAGFSAALASARQGANTLIIEQFPYFGGTATASLMANIVGVRNQVKPNDLQVMKGIGEELILALLENGGAHSSPETYKSERHSDTKGDLSYTFAFDTEKFKYLTLKMAVEAGVHILFHTRFSDIIQGGDKVTGIIFENKSGRQAAFAKVVVDATGDGDAAYCAGVPYWQVENDEAPRLNDSLMYRIGGFPDDTAMRGCRTAGTMVVWGPSSGPGNAASGDGLTEEEIRVRLAVYDDFSEKKMEVPDLRDAYIVETPALIGIRQTRFFEGEYKITGEDVIEGIVPEDSIAMAANPIIHYYGYRRFLEHEGYGIPYRCLVPKKVDGLLLAGRCISSDQRAFESWRAMAHIFCIGEAAGTAAAISAQDGVEPRKINIEKLRRTLIENGAEIGQNKKI